MNGNMAESDSESGSPGKDRDEVKRDQVLGGLGSGGRGKRVRGNAGRVAEF